MSRPIDNERFPGINAPTWAQRQSQEMHQLGEQVWKTQSMAAEVIEEVARGSEENSYEMDRLNRAVRSATKATDLTTEIMLIFAGIFIGFCIGVALGASLPVCALLAGVGGVGVVLGSWGWTIIANQFRDSRGL